MNAQDIADSTREAMWEDDRASRALGMQVISIGPGSATMTMTVREDMLNAHELCHGGLLAALADSAFAFASNSYNELTVASGFDINLIASARRGDVLTATAREMSKSGRTGVYDVTLVKPPPPLGALLEGQAHRGGPADEIGHRLAIRWLSTD
jgi:acyl-CoA thioesterase